MYVNVSHEMFDTIMAETLREFPSKRRLIGLCSMAMLSWGGDFDPALASSLPAEAFEIDLRIVDVTNAAESGRK